MRRHVERVLDLWKVQRFLVGVADRVPLDGDIRFAGNIAEVRHNG